MEGTLQYCINNLTKNVPDPHGTIQYFLDNKMDDVAINRIICSLEEDLSRIPIRVKGSVDYDDHSSVISHKDLYDCLKNNIKYHRDTAIEKDVNSISAIERLRKGEKFKEIKRCRAIFITNNYLLSYNVKKHFYTEETSRIIPPVLHDSILTNIMWLKNPSDVPDLPRKRLIAETFAATRPPESVWAKFIEVIKLHESQYKEDDIYFLRYTASAQEMLMDISKGDPDVITVGTISEILAEKERQEQAEKDRIAKERDVEIQRKNEELEKIRLEMKKRENELAMKNESEEDRATELASNFAKKWASIIYYGLVVIIVGFITLLNFNFINNTWANIFLFVITVLIPTVTLFQENESFLKFYIIKEKIYTFIFNKYKEKIQAKYYRNAI
ncbi:hypothetical protein [Gracilibacillus dipsosauri]|uniref:Uncharacterized protein n=1 Tax=Gracilibacillus dipsosauri TaxID=178340 RepID=A0A317L542_9BACI|nr:hypothetical protein [Gracilibacillus dipsosauri]PWU69988.1 hypothetical protein DLJ74_03435 [Gracilibacillus dipsosauri]